MSEDQIVDEVDVIETEAAPAADAITEDHQEAVLDPELLGDAEVVDIADEDEDEVVVEPSPYDRDGDWYVIHSYAGYENKVKQNLASRVRSMNVEEHIFEVVIPMEDVIEFKGGRKVVVQKKVFPGYVMVRMHLDDDSWYVVRNTPGVTGFVGNGAKPTPLSRKEVESILGSGGVLEEGHVEKKGATVLHTMWANRSVSPRDHSRNSLESFPKSTWIGPS